jgi:hypothetical protein
MKDIEILNSLVNEIKDKEKLDQVYNEILFPRLKLMASRLRTKKIDITENENDYKIATNIEFIMDRKGFTLQNLIETQMRPYLEEKGFKITTWTPSYSVTISW